VAGLAYRMKFVLPPCTHEAAQVIDMSLGDRNIRAHNHQARLLGMRPYMRHDQRRIWFNVVIKEEQERPGSGGRTTIARSSRPLVWPLENDEPQGERRVVALQHVDGVIIATVGHDEDFESWMRVGLESEGMQCPLQRGAAIMRGNNHTHAW